jgi:hypothetical protein
MIKLPSIVRNPKRHPAFRRLFGSKVPDRRLPAPAWMAHGSDALAEACELFALRISDEREPVFRPLSIGIAASDEAGSRCWLRLSRHPNREAASNVRDLLLRISTVRGVPMPSILNSADWEMEDAHWLALQTTLAPPAVEQGSYARENAGNLSDEWIASLKRALDNLAAADLPARRAPSEAIRNAIEERWGPRAQHAVEEWRIAHGDLQWSNVTAPELMILDWSGWRLAPRGYDAAKLIIGAFHQPALVDRLEKAFSEDLESKSGAVSLLVAAAERLKKIENKRGTKRYEAWIREKASRIVSRK